jgi:hypothetical protein
MKRLLALLALLVIPGAGSAQSVISCPGVTSGTTCDGFNVVSGRIREGTFTFFGDNGLGYLISPSAATDFTFASALFQSALGVHNNITVYGYSRAFINNQFGFFPNGSAGGPSTYRMSFQAEPDAPREVIFNWADLGALGFDSGGGRIPGQNDFAYLFNVSQVTVFVTPEPATSTLVAFGLLLIVVMTRRHSAASRAAGHDSAPS